MLVIKEDGTEVKLKGFSFHKVVNGDHAEEGCLGEAKKGKMKTSPDAKAAGDSSAKDEM